jgi:hypothetical protein
MPAADAVRSEGIWRREHFAADSTETGATATGPTPADETVQNPN